MKKHHIIPLFVLALLLVVTGCKKRKARKTLLGEWNIVFYDIRIFDECLGFENTFAGASRTYGRAEFEKGRFWLACKFDDDDGVEDDFQCIPEYEHSGEWKVTGHDRELLIEHQYKLELHGHIWDLVFQDEQRAYVKANGSQDMISLNTTFPNGDEMYLELIRDE